MLGMEVSPLGLGFSFSLMVMEEGRILSWED